MISRWSQVVPVKGLFDPQRGCYPQVESHWSKRKNGKGERKKGSVVLEGQGRNEKNYILVIKQLTFT